MKARAQELARLGLATEAKRGMLTFSPDWQERLGSMELHLNVRKRVMLERTAERQAELTKAATRAIARGIDR